MTIVVNDTELNDASITESTESVAEDTVKTVEATSEELVESTPTEETAVEAEPTSEIPGKYADKSFEEVVAMHQEVEKLKSRQANELGEMRALLKQVLESQQQTNTAQAVEEPEYDFSEAFYDDPQEAINKAIANHPEIQQAKQVQIQAKQAASVQKLESMHPDFREVVASDGFNKWLEDNPGMKYTYDTADANYDPVLGANVLSMYKQTNMMDATKKAQEKQDKARQKALKQTSSETRSAGDSTAGKKIYRSQDLIELRQRDPEKYAAYSEDIYQAYQEGRVR